MKLIDIITGFAVHGEQAQDAVRRQYIANVEALDAEGTTLPASPSKLTSAPPQTIGPESIEYGFTVCAWLGKDGEIEAELSSSKKRSGFFRREIGSLVDVKMRFSAHAPPEAVSRTRVMAENELTRALRKVEWSGLKPATNPKGDEDHG